MFEQAGRLAVKPGWQFDQGPGCWEDRNCVSLSLEWPAEESVCNHQCCRLELGVDRLGHLVVHLEVRRIVAAVVVHLGKIDLVEDPRRVKDKLASIPSTTCFTMRKVKINELVRIRPELTGMVTAGIGLESGIVTGMMYMQVVVMHSRDWVTDILPVRRVHLAVVHGVAVAVVAARRAVDMVEVMRRALEAPEADCMAKMVVADMEVEESMPVGPQGQGHSVAQGVSSLLPRLSVTRKLAHVVCI